MGILNVTPDSFSDGGRFYSLDRAMAHALRMLDAGADILDVGGESTRPGKRETVDERTELERVLPLVIDIHRQRPQAILSIDSYKAGVARLCLQAGAEIVNDISALQWDSHMPEVVAEAGCGAVLMHTRGRPEQWAGLPPLPDPTDLVKKELAYQAGVALKFSIAREQLVLDPGFGFGKRFEENYALLARLGELHELGLPVLVGASRKSFLGRTLADPAGVDAPVEDRLSGSLAAAVASVMAGAHIVRVHDVEETLAAVKIADALLAARQLPG